MVRTDKTIDIAIVYRANLISLELYILEIVGAIVAKLVNHAVDYALSICSVCPCEARDVVVETVP